RRTRRPSGASPSPSRGQNAFTGHYIRGGGRPFSQRAPLISAPARGGPFCFSSLPAGHSDTVANTAPPHLRQPLARNSAHWRLFTFSQSQTGTGLPVGRYIRP